MTRVDYLRKWMGMVCTYNTSIQGLLQHNETSKDMELVMIMVSERLLARKHGHYI